MKIALNLEHFSLSKGGIEVYANNFAGQLLNNGHEVHIFAHTFDDNIQRGNKQLHFHKVPRTDYPKFIRDLSFALGSIKTIKQHNPDIVIGFSKNWEVDVIRPGGGTERRWYEQNIKSLHAGTISRSLSAALKQLSLTSRIKFSIDSKIYQSKRLKMVIANSNMVKKDIIKYHGLAEDKIRTVYNGVDLKRFSPGNQALFRERTRDTYSIKDTELAILFLAHNFRLKGLHCLISALSPLKKKADIPLKLIVAGRGKKSKYQVIADRSGCGKDIIFTGQAEMSEKLYSAADIFVHPTFYDPFANVCIEALASGLPVITTSYNGASELITEGVEGSVVSDPRDTHSLADKIGLYLDPSARQEAGVKARKLAEQYPLEKNFKEIFETISSLY